MSANAQIVSILLVLAVAAAALRIATGPIVALKGGDSLYAKAKAGPAPGAQFQSIEMAVSEARPGQ